MRIIDAHMHLSDIRMFYGLAEKLEYGELSQAAIQKEYEDTGVVACVGMGVDEVDGDFPSKVVETPMLNTLADGFSGMYHVMGINPYKLSKKNLEQIDSLLSKEEFVGVKLYSGYYPYGANDTVYRPIYEIVYAHNAVVYVHCGAINGDGVLKYAHPLLVDEVAVALRDINFVICHLGYPWMMDAAVVVNKNDNVWTDLSGLVVGGRDEVREELKRPYEFGCMQMGITALAGKLDRVLFGTDWPLASVSECIRLTKKLIPRESWQDVFYNNAARLLRLRA